MPALSDREDMEGVVQKAFGFGSHGRETAKQNLLQMAGPMLDFAWWFNNTVSFFGFCLNGGTYMKIMILGFVALCEERQPYQKSVTCIEHHDIPSTKQLGLFPGDALQAC